MICLSFIITICFNLISCSISLTDVLEAKSLAKHFFENHKRRKSRKLISTDEISNDKLAHRLIEHAFLAKQIHTGNNSRSRKLKSSETDINNFSKRSLSNELDLFKTPFTALKKSRILLDNLTTEELKSNRELENTIFKIQKDEDEKREEDKQSKIKKKKDVLKRKMHQKFFVRRNLRNLY